MHLRPYVAALLACVTVGGAGSPATTTAAAASLTPAAATLSTTPSTDTAGTGRLLAAANAARRAAGVESLFGRASYNATAVAMATAVVEARTVPTPTDGAPSVYAGGTAPEAEYDAAVDAAVANLVSTAHAVTTYALHTDAGVAVVREAVAGGVRYGIALVVGWPPPPVATDTGCATTRGYCWSTRGLNPHLPWTRNQVKWYLSTAGLPTAGESLVKTAIATLNKVNGFGADLVYAGKATTTTPDAAHRFVVVWGSGCPTADALACTIDSTQGSDHFVYQARTIVTASRYAANPGTTWWVGTLMHEIAHASGLGHFNGTYGGTYQLMRWADGPNAVQHGDANGLRRLAASGIVTASLRAVRGGGTHALVVRASNSGLGGLRAMHTECRDASGTWRIVARLAGTWDGRTADRTLGSATSGQTCRAVVRSKARTVTTAAVTLA
jgi:hypothetical protein